jgi:enoyl-CoA hydratase/carnithine racemase
MSEVEYETTGPTARITINRPEQRNAMSGEVIRSLGDALEVADHSADVRVVVVTGAGDRAFSAGADLGGMGPGAPIIEGHETRRLLADVFRRLRLLDKPSVARVQGFALAGGFGLALACDFVVASSDAVFGTPEVNVGLWPYMITVPLLRSMPPRYALELMMTGRRVTADEAHKVGFINRVVEPDKLDEAVDELVGQIASKPPTALRLGRRAFYNSLEMNWDAALDYLQGMLTVTISSDDTAEGLAAFAEKRKPNWTGR